MKRFFSHSGDLPLALDLKATTSTIAARDVGTIPDFLAHTSRLKSLSIETSSPPHQSRVHRPWFTLFLETAHQVSKQQGNPCWKSMQSLKFKSTTTISPHNAVPLFEVAPSLGRLELAFHYVMDVAFVQRLVVKLDGLRYFRIDCRFRCSSVEKVAFLLQIILSLPRLASLTTIHDRHDPDSPISQLEVISLILTLPVKNLNLSHLDL